MNIENLRAIIELVPLLMVYVVPGYIIIRINSFQLSRDTAGDYYIILKSVVISFIIVTALEWIWQTVNPDAQPIYLVSFKVVLLLSAVAIGIFWSRFIVSDFCAKLLSGLGINRALSPGIWQSVVDYEFGLWVMVYISGDSVVYMGKMRRFVENDRSQSYFLLLSNYALYDYSGQLLQDYRQEVDKWVVLHSKDIKRVEIYYHPRSKKI
jgi:hypothetical protein